MVGCSDTQDDIASEGTAKGARAHFDGDVMPAANLPPGYAWGPGASANLALIMLSKEPDAESDDTPQANATDEPYR
jgi:hypothetical protein